MISQIDDSIIYESLIVNDYIEEAYPEPALSPKNPKDKAYDRVLVEANFESVSEDFCFSETQIH